MPVIVKAKELGHTVAVVDYNSGAIGVRYADDYFNVSTIDIEAICNVAVKFRPDGIMTTATDMPVRSVAAATTLLGLPGISFETAVMATDKGEMIKAFKEKKVESPWYFIIDNRSKLKSVANQLSFPCILKPTDNAGSRGVILVKEYGELNTAYEYSIKQSRTGKVIIEEFMEGSEVSAEVMAINGEVHILAVTDKLTTGPPYFVELGHSQQSQLDETAILQIKDLAVKAVNAIGITQGPAHVEIMLTRDGPRMVELGARMGGDYITTHLVPLSTGIDMVKASIFTALGKEPDINPEFNKGSAIRYFNVPQGVILSITGVEEAKKLRGVKECNFTMGVGDAVSGFQSSTDRVGSVIAQGANAREAIEICEQASKIITILTR